MVSTACICINCLPIFLGILYSHYIHHHQVGMVNCSKCVALHYAYWDPSSRVCDHHKQNSLIARTLSIARRQPYKTSLLLQIAFTGKCCSLFKRRMWQAQLVEEETQELQQNNCYFLQHTLHSLSLSLSLSLSIQLLRVVCHTYHDE